MPAPPVAASPTEAITTLVWAFARSQAVFVAARLGLIDRLRDGPLSSDALAAAIGAHEPTLRRLLRALTTIDLLVEDRDGRFAATEASAPLRSDHPQSLHPFALMMGESFVWRPWGDLHETVLTGSPAFDRLYGEPFFTYLGHRPREAAAFDAAMSGLSRRDLAAILAAYDFSACARIVDVAGGQGALLGGILARYPQATGVLFDLPGVVATARGVREHVEAGRCDVTGGDMFASVPAGGDTYLLKYILHDWGDDACLQILRNIRRAIAPGGRLLVVESVVKPANEPDGTKWADLMMLVVMTGRERAEAEFRALFAAADFGFVRVIPAGGEAIIEAIPI